MTSQTHPAGLGGKGLKAVGFLCAFSSAVAPADWHRPAGCFESPLTWTLVHLETPTLLRLRQISAGVICRQH